MAWVLVPLDPEPAQERRRALETPDPRTLGETASYSIAELLFMQGLPVQQVKEIHAAKVLYGEGVALFQDL